MYPAAYHSMEVFRFRHVKVGHVFEVTEKSATRNVPAGHYVRASARKALPCTYSSNVNSKLESSVHVNADTCGVVYVPAHLPVIQTQV
tara:strand:- start:3470 stop:3733 length:264 start_codon:yes stop_codon:yes gene_type:complete